MLAMPSIRVPASPEDFERQAELLRERDRLIREDRIREMFGLNRPPVPWPPLEIIQPEIRRLPIAEFAKTDP